MMSKIIPSIMATSQKELDLQLSIASKITKSAHLDIVDGKFAPSKVLWFKFKLLKNLSYTAHLMIEQPEKWIKKNLEDFDLFLPHIEKLSDIDNYYTWITKYKKPCAFALLPETKVSTIKEFVLKAKYILVLTVHPGFYGNTFLPAQIKKISQIKKINPNVKIIVDGGMNPKRIVLAKKAGADIFISGSYVMKSDDPKKRLKELEKLIK